MTLQSMTGFARASSEDGPLQATWELKSVNNKTLDLRLRLPPSLERLEAPARQAFAKRIARGSVQANLTLTRAGAGATALGVNDARLWELAALAQRLVRDFGAAPARADGLLGLRGVIETDAAEPPAMDEGGDALVLRTLDEALDRLVGARAVEGAALGRLLSGRIDAVERLAARVEADPARQPAAVRARLKGQVALLLEAHGGLDEARLTAEAALLATRADVREEIDRLRTHTQAVRAHLAEGGPVGRRLDFLSQELNREANTLCAKSNTASVTAAGLELKAVVDQFREQVQNLE